MVNYTQCKYSIKNGLKKKHFPIDSIPPFLLKNNVYAIKDLTFNYNTNEMLYILYISIPI